MQVILEKIVMKEQLQLESKDFQGAYYHYTYKY